MAKIKYLIMLLAFIAFELKAASFHSKYEFKVFGLTQNQVVQFDGDPQGTACSKQHYQNDLSNRWCHSLFVKIVDERLQRYNLPPVLSALLAGSIFVPKEYYWDKNPSLADIGIADFELFRDEVNNQSLHITAFLDGAFIINITKVF